MNVHYYLSKALFILDVTSQKLSTMVHPLLNQKAPTLTLPDANGEPFELKPGKDGVPTAIFFYPTSGEGG